MRLRFGSGSYEDKTSNWALSKQLQGQLFRWRHNRAVKNPEFHLADFTLLKPGKIQRTLNALLY